MGAWQHLCQPTCPWDKEGLGEQLLGSANTSPGWEGMASSGLKLKEWSQVCVWGVRSLFGTEVRDKLGNKVVVIGQKGEKACSVHGSQRGWPGSG